MSVLRVVVPFALVMVVGACGDVANPRIEDIGLVVGQTFTEKGAKAGEPIRLSWTATEAQMIQFRGWSAGALVGFSGRLLDAEGTEIATVDSPGTDFRLDGVRLATAGTYTLEGAWKLGEGVAGYRLTVLSTGDSPVNARSVGSMSTGRIGHQATRLSDGRVLITGGQGAGDPNGALGTPMASAEIYDPTTGEATPTGDMASARAWHSAVLIVSGDPQLVGKVLVAGGIGPKGDALLTTEIYDPATGVFSAAPNPLPEPRAFMTLASIDGTGSFLDGKIVFVGGERTRGQPQHDYEQQLYTEIDENPTDLWFFDPDVGTIQVFERLEFGRVGATVSLLSDGRLLIVGGGVDTLPSAPGCDTSALGCYCTSSQIPLCTQFEQCDTEQCHWTSYTRKDLGHRSVEVYDTQTGARIMLPKADWLKRGRVGHAAAVLPGDRVVVAGGATALRRSFQPSEYGLPEAPTTLDSVEIYDPLESDPERHWRIVSPLAIPREQAVLSVLGATPVLVGGFTPTQAGLRPVRLIEVMTPQSRVFSAFANLSVGRGAAQAALLDGSSLLVVGGAGSSGSPLPATLERISVVALPAPTLGPPDAGDASPDAAGDAAGD